MSDYTQENFDSDVRAAERLVNSLQDKILDSIKHEDGIHSRDIYGLQIFYSLGAVCVAQLLKKGQSNQIRKEDMDSKIENMLSFAKDMVAQNSEEQTLNG